MLSYSQCCYLFPLSTMELNALSRWESIGKDLYARGKLGSEIERIKQFSKMLSASRKKQRHSPSSSSRAQPAQLEEQQQQAVKGSSAPHHESKLSGITESKDESEAGVDVDGDESLNDVSPLPLLDAIEAAEAAAANKQEERMQDEIEEKELDSIPPTHARVSDMHATRNIALTAPTLQHESSDRSEVCRGTSS